MFQHMFRIYVVKSKLKIQLIHVATGAVLVGLFISLKLPSGNCISYYFMNISVTKDFSCWDSTFILPVFS